MSIRLVTIDLDETLLSTDKTYDRDRFKQVVRQLDDLGTMVMISTGNNFAKMADYFDDTLLNNLYFACDNGNYLVHGDELVRRRGLESNTQTAIIDFLQEIPGINLFFSSGEDVKYIAKDRAFEELALFYNPGATKVEHTTDLDELVKITIHTKEGLEYKKRLSRIINERYPDAIAVTSGSGFMDIFHRKGGKGEAVRFIQERYGISKAETMSFGDSLNDESMFNVSDYAVAMENADPELVLSATHQIKSNNDQAVIAVLEQLVHAQDLSFMNQYKLKNRESHA